MSLIVHISAFVYVRGASALTLNSPRHLHAPITSERFLNSFRSLESDGVDTDKLLQKVDKTLHEQIPQTEMVASFITTEREPYRSRSLAAWQTWSSHFEGRMAFTFDDAPFQPWITHVEKLWPDEATQHATNMNLAMIPEMQNSYPKAKWYLQADDDSLILPHQWRAAAKQFDWSRPVLAGKCANVPPVFMRKQYEYKEWLPFTVGGAGILMSRTLVAMLKPHIPNCRRKFNDLYAGDIRISACMLDVFGLEFVRSAVKCLPGASDRFPPRGNPVMTIHTKNTEIYVHLWKALQAEIVGGRPVTTNRIEEVMNDTPKMQMLWQSIKDEGKKRESQRLEQQRRKVLTNARKKRKSRQMERHDVSREFNEVAGGSLKTELGVLAA